MIKQKIGLLTQFHFFNVFKIIPERSKILVYIDSNYNKFYFLILHYFPCNA